jgi:nitrate/TMAO reductase-like tetraheme cytochrome c subunit
VADFNRPTNPNHAAGGLSHQCQTCHTTAVWKPSIFSHDNTKFPLSGAHRAVACTSCHTNNQYATVSTNCIDCHRSDYTGATNPNHTTLGFPQTCLQCHTTTAWKPASFDHNTTKFSLTGKHTLATCLSCHVNANYQLVYTDCYQCHSVDFAKPTNPNHVLPGFSHQCQLCHTTTAWVPSTFNHDGSFFKIYSGKHRGTWTLCTQCHASPSSYTAFTCISCHEHSSTEMNSKHNGVREYIYSATSCYSCHKGV